MNKILIKFESMKKEEKSTPEASRPRTFFKYELKDTNQGLKDAGDLYHNSILSTAQSHKQNCSLLEDIDHEIFDFPFIEKHTKINFKEITPEINHNNLFSFDYCGKDYKNKLFQENQIEEHWNFKNYLSHEKQSTSQKNQHFYEENSENDSNALFGEKEAEIEPKKYQNSQRHKLVQFSTKKDSNSQCKKENKRQSKGLANISLKVKNIVSCKQRLTYKEVSDEVLHESQEDLPSDKVQREKQIKNIRRRVYDALNVLVSAGILGKHQRCVTLTEETNFQGKKLSNMFQKVTNLQAYLENLRNRCKEKEKSLKLLEIHYKSVKSLRTRNEMLFENNFEPQNQEESSKINESEQNKRFNFPLIFVVPPNSEATATVQIQNLSEQQKIRQVKISGSNLKVFTDANAVQYIDLHAYSDEYSQHQQKIEQYFQDVHPDLRNNDDSELPSLRPSSHDIYLSDD